MGTFAIDLFTLLLSEDELLAIKKGQTLGTELVCSAFLL